jgi:hypothetical protein
MYSIFFIGKIRKLITNLFSDGVSTAEGYTALNEIGV